MGTRLSFTLELDPLKDTDNSISMMKLDIADDLTHAEITMTGESTEATLAVTSEIQTIKAVLTSEQAKSLQRALSIIFD